MRTFRKNKINIIVISLLLGLSACNKEEVDISEPDGFMKINVVDNGYISAEPLDSRIATDGMKTTFTDGDIIGVFTVVNGKVNQTNVGMMYSSDIQGWSGLLKKENEENAKYYAYYPWKEDLQGTVNPEATDAAGFFKGVIDAWTISEDQCTYKKYTMGDLMVGGGEIGKERVLNFTLSHQMGLVVIDMPVMRYNFTNTEPELKDYIIPAKGTYFDCVKPALLHDGSYRFLMKPGEKTVEGGYEKDGKKYKFKITPNLQQGKYKRYKVDGGAGKVQKHNLQPGDYFMKNGNLISKGTALTEQQKKDCIGIVFWVGDATTTDPMLKTDYPNSIHGLVCSVRDGENAKWQENAKNYIQTIQNWVANNTTGFANLVTNTGADDNMNRNNGYNNTKGMILFNQANGLTKNNLDIVDKLINFRAQNPVPDFTSGWYIPSIKELYIMMNKDVPDIYSIEYPSGVNYELLSSVFKSLGKQYADQFNSKEGAMGRNYFSSSEHNIFTVWCVCSDSYSWEGQTYYLTMVGESTKDYLYCTRFILSF